MKAKTGHRPDQVGLQHPLVHMSVEVGKIDLGCSSHWQELELEMVLPEPGYITFRQKTSTEDRPFQKGCSTSWHAQDPMMGVNLVGEFNRIPYWTTTSSSKCESIGWICLDGLCTCWHMQNPEMGKV